MSAAAKVSRDDETNSRMRNDCVGSNDIESFGGLVAEHLPESNGRPGARVASHALAALARRIGVTTEGLEYVGPECDPFILAINHTQKLEALLVPALLASHRNGKQVHFLVDWNFLLIPGLAWLIRRNNPIVVNRKPARPAWLNVLRPYFNSRTPPFAQARQLLAAKRSIGIYPEGTTNSRTGQLMRGLHGAARLSLATGVPVVPAGIRFENGRASEFSPFSVKFGAPLFPPAGCEVAEWHARIMGEIAHLSGKSWEPSNPRTKYENKHSSLAC